MSGNWKRSSRWIGGALAIGVLVWAFMPEPLPVEKVVVQRGPLKVTVDEDGELRAHDRYIIAAPIGGRLMRITLREGDTVAENQVLALLAPIPLSVREREEQTARVAAAQAMEREAQEHVRRAQADQQQASRERERAELLVDKKLVSPQKAEEARTAESTSRNEVEGARFRVRSAAADVQATKAMLNVGAQSSLVELRAPVAARVLSVSEQSERVVSAGTSLLTLGDPSRYEVVLDVLSTEAVKVSPGMTMLVENWGGEKTLHAKVRVVEPSAFTKVSALGVEEQRVNIIADLVDPPGQLGNNYRVEGRIVIWEAGDVLKAPLSSLFRVGEDWAVFVIKSKRAHQRAVVIGHRSGSEAEVLKGLEAGEMLVRHPSNQLAEGTRVKVLEN